LDTVSSNPSEPTKFSICTPNWIPYIDEDSPHNGHDASVLNLSNIPTIPIFITASSGDTTVQIHFNALVLKWRLINAGWQETVNPTTGPELFWQQQTKEHGDDTHFVPTLMNPFFDRALL
jgi:hypothetical protein